MDGGDWGKEKLALLLIIVLAILAITSLLMAFVYYSHIRLQSFPSVGALKE
ncbi:hypothetical protein HPP92_007925 [Vanilla planifolia]|uniref:Uncharacterized protein n=1 Tax=Vanilla planifolia TaxID=51239 RepID=A0A835VA27_VANPL|nr:hypothetical protein HPP92_007925 [Vanilla planifolia]